MFYEWQTTDYDFISRILEISNGGENLDYKLIEDILLQEVEFLSTSDPLRNFKFSEKNGKCISPLHAKYFARRTGLSKIMLKNGGLSKTLECDICSKRFSFQNCLIKHKKSIHFPFLQ